MAPSLSADQVNAFVAETFPLAAEAGFRCEEIGERTATGRWSFRASSLRPGDLINGPTIFGLADITLWFAGFTVIGLEAMSVTAEMSIRFLRPARGGDLLARATINAATSRRVVGTIEVWVDGSPDRPVAVAQGTYAVP